ncbi:hypothetical protein FS837_008806 [Tulasnella sp. UAMH 9824]|nr:hypothetical protein FS837_008806 [Tulasnella sp. UAMH 9824]
MSINDNRIARSPPAILNLCLVSRLFLQLADPFRFREIHLAISMSVPPPRKMSYIQEFLGSLDVRQEVKSWVKTFDVGVYPSELWDHEPPYAYIAMLPRIQSLIPELRTLHRLRCSLAAFTPSLYSGILQLETLETLHLNLDRPDLRAGNTDYSLDQTANHPICPVRRLDINGEMANTGAATSAILALVQLGTLTELKYWARVWPETPRGITLFQAIKEYIPNHTFGSLRYLEVVMPTSGDAQWFLHFGERCPNVMELKVHRNFIDHPRNLALWLKNQFTERHFPSLQCFAGPLALVPIFAQNRPVYSVETSLQPFGVDPSDPTTPAQAIEAIRPSVPIRVLDLFVQQWDDNDIEAVSQHHPHVEELSYNCLNGQYMTISSVSRFFHRLTDPFRFQIVHFMGHPYQQPMLMLHRIGTFLDLLERRPEIKSWIHVLSIGKAYFMIQDQTVDYSYRIMGARGHKVVPKLQNLRSLQCGSMSFSSSLFGSIFQLQQLEKLEVEDFQMKEDLSDPTPNWDTMRQHGGALQRLRVKAVVSSSPQTTSALICLLQQESLTKLEYWPHIFSGNAGRSQSILDDLTAYSGLRLYAPAATDNYVPTV